MKRPMVALLVSPESRIREGILEGTITASVREGHRDYRRGDILVLFCPWVVWSVLADIVEVRHVKLADLRPEECHAAGYPSLGRLFEGLRIVYPNITLSSPVTVIRWENVRGTLVDAHRGR